MKSSDDAINEILKQQGFEGLSVSGAGNASGRVDSVNLTMRRTIDQATLDRALRSKDEATTVLLLTLEIEQQLSGFLEDLIGTPIENANNLNTLVLMLKVCRFENDLFEIVDGFRKLRNKFAHEKDASLAKHAAIVDRILRCTPPAVVEDEIHSVSDGTTTVKIKDLPKLLQLFIHANFVTLFLATANQIYSFSKPFKRVRVDTSRSSASP